MVICSAVDSRGEVVMMDEDAEENVTLSTPIGSVDVTNLEELVWSFVGQSIVQLMW